MSIPDPVGVVVAPPLLETISPALLDSPLDYIHADHFRLRSLCVALKRMADSGHASRREAEEILTFLRRDLELHHGDEERDLFPAVRRRSLPADELDPVLKRLSEDRMRAAPLASGIVIALMSEGDSLPLSPAARKVMQTYAAREHRHLAIENGIVLAIARIRLTRKDLLRISAGMKARRGIAA